MASLSECNDLMARVPKTNGAAEKSSTAQSKPGFVEWFFRPSMLFRVALVAGVCALWPYAAQRLPSLGKRSEYRISFRQIQISPAPDKHIPADLIEQVERIAGFTGELSILDDHLASDIAEAFSRHPWVAKVVRVKKAFPSSISVELEYRRPVAMVQVGTTRIPVDNQAVVLPVGDLSQEECDRLPLVQNILSKPAARPGIIWSDPNLQVAIRLADLLGDKWNALKLEAISVARHVDLAEAADDVQLELSGLGGSKILWGRSPDSDHPGELEPSQKIRRLENYLAEFGDYGQPNGPYEIDIRHWRENTRRPLNKDRVQTKPPKNNKDESRIQNSEGRRKSRG